MEKVISNYTSVGNTEDKNLRVTQVIAAVAIKERTNVMTNNVAKFATKKVLSTEKAKEPEFNL